MTPHIEHHPGHHHADHNPAEGIYEDYDPGGAIHEDHDHGAKHSEDSGYCAKFHKESDSLASGRKGSCCVSDNEDKSAEALVAENLMALSITVSSLGETIEMLVQKAASMAYHIIATEEILSEIAVKTGLDLAQVNARIRAKINAGTENMGYSDLAIDVAASIASPHPRL